MSTATWIMVVCAMLAACAADDANGSNPSGGSAAIGAGAGGAGALGGMGAGAVGGMSAGGAGVQAGAGDIGGNAGTAGADAGAGAGGSGGEPPIMDGSIPDATAPDVTSERGTIIPTAEWTCGLPMGIPAPADGTLVLDVELTLEPALKLGATQYGDRTILVTTSGTVTGDAQGEVLVGGLDWEAQLPSGARELETRHVLRTSSGTLIYMRGCGVGIGSATRVMMELEVSGGSAQADLQSGTYVATREVGEGTARYAIYRFDDGFAIDATAPVITIERSAEDRALRAPTWDCAGPPAGSSEGAQILEATVRIGGSLAIGTTQVGSRNIIPITGGTFTGMGASSSLEGEVIPGGADFQVTPAGGTFQIEARYVLRTADGDLIAVRNCGGFGGTVPLFEVALDSPYAYLNDGDYFGRIGISIGAVIISVFERL
jgi:hypothetical protein